MTLLPKPAYLDDPRNDDLLVHVDGRLVPRDQAAISVYDNGFAMGDAVYETMRLVAERIAFLDAHLERLLAGLRLLGFLAPPSRATLMQAIAATIAGNEIEGAAQIRLIVTRGRKRTPDHDPRTVISPPSIVICPEYPVYRPQGAGTTTLATAAIRYAPPESGELALKLPARPSHILALIQAREAGAEAALMLDARGVIAGGNSANFFAVEGRTLRTPDARHCFDGITRRVVMQRWRDAGGSVREGDIVPADLQGIDEAFLTATTDGVVPVVTIDGRPVGSGTPGPVTSEVTRLYAAALHDG